MFDPIMTSLIADGKVTRGWLGVVIRTVDSNLAGQLDLHRKTGVLVAEVSKGSPAAGAGLKKGDIILSIGGESTMSSAELRNRVAMSGSNVEVDLEIDRAGDIETLKVVLGELP
jgi:S1-C subfamily serine protease